MTSMFFFLLPLLYAAADETHHKLTTIYLTLFASSQLLHSSSSNNSSNSNSNSSSSSSSQKHDGFVQYVRQEDQFHEELQPLIYCSVDCQRRDWKEHKPTCKRKEFAGAPCDFCGNTEDIEYGDVFFHCGSLYCKVCDEQYLCRDLSGEVVSFEPCPRCNKRSDFCCPSDRKKLEKLIKESPRDPRLANWLVVSWRSHCSL
jgi:MYND finger